MKQETYQNLAKKITCVSWGLPLVRTIGKVLTYLTALFYLTVLFLLFRDGEYRKMLVFVFVPMFTFIAVSVFRAGYNKKRPYELYDIIPLIPKETQGKSFPSRHIFSIYVIGTTIWFYEPAAGMAVCIMGVFLAVIRVVTGVHFPKDVIAGAVTGVLSGLLAGVILWLIR